jgi:hypothetical protein
MTVTVGRNRRNRNTRKLSKENPSPDGRPTGLAGLLLLLLLLLLLESALSGAARKCTVRSISIFPPYHGRGSLRKRVFPLPLGNKTRKEEQKKMTISQIHQTKYGATQPSE